ncbi:prepilin peptidase [Micromonospora sp. NPDC048170]|uniref:prepilin peptidase n=1 Tax=Micromonospora sp. NPDC048170 TaxID=3154819 RepID=UPI0033E79695
MAESTAPPDAARGARLLAVLALAPALRLAVIRHAVPPGVATRTGCDACGAPIGLTRPWPALGPTARCGRCGTRVGPPPGAMELAVTAALGALVLLGLPADPAGGAWLGGEPAVLAATAWWLGWAIPLVFVDAAVHRLPDRLTWPAAAGTWLLLGLAALAGTGPTPWLRATAAGIALALFFATTTLLLGQRGFGLGDAKLALGAGALLGWHGWAVPLVGLVLALLLSGLVGVALLIARRVDWRSHLPFGPYLALGTLAALLLP